MLLVLHGYRRHEKDLHRYPHRKRIYLVVMVVILMFFVSVAEITLWAVTYLTIGAIERMEAALYFSMVTFTTLGYGDITLSEQWRLLASFEAANGIIMFGWSTALVITTVQRVFFSEKRNGSQSRN
jgi:voltage-gated potassium channel Kch